jgi:hypothetical protein
MAVSPFVDAVARFIIALLGGATLLVPMIVMLFDESKVKSIVVVCVAVTVFAVGVSALLKASNSDTLTATAAYAAVLVVFVGSNGS